MSLTADQKSLERKIFVLNLGSPNGDFISEEKLFVTWSSMEKDFGADTLISLLLYFCI